jgi:hypothetical protein
MMGRKDKLNFLIKFINDNAALSKVRAIRLDSVYLAAEMVADVPIESSATFYRCGETARSSSSLVET